MTPSSSSDSILTLEASSPLNGVAGQPAKRSETPPDTITEALASQRWEIARRLCLQWLQKKALSQAGRNALLFQLHHAYRMLGDFPSSRSVLDQIKPCGKAESCELLLCAAEDLEWFSKESFYRTSSEAKAGLTLDQYAEALWDESRRKLQAAAGLCESANHRKRSARLQQRLDPLSAPSAPIAVSPVPELPPLPPGSVAGTLRFEDGTAVAGVRICLGLQADVTTLDPVRDLCSEMDWKPTIPSLRALWTETDARGDFRFHEVPPGRHEFLAVMLDPARYEISTRFIAHAISVSSEEETCLNLPIADWKSAPVEELSNPWPETLERQGQLFRLVHREILNNPFDYDFPRQPVSCALAEEKGGLDESLLLIDSTHPEIPLSFQRSGKKIVFLVELPARSHRSIALYRAETAQAAPIFPDSPLFAFEAEGTILRIETGRASFLIPYGGEKAAPPLLSVRGEDGLWRGKGRWKLPPGLSIVRRHAEIVEKGPVFLSVRIDYLFSNGASYAWIVTAYQGEPLLLVDEISDEIADAAFEFSLQECSGGRGYLHWKKEGIDRHWSDLRSEARELARLQESVAWWIPPQGFAYAMTPASEKARDYIAVFTRQRGEWIDRKFSRLAQGPGDDHRELDWPFPEMVGSTLSMITAQTDAAGDAFFQFGCFDGERRWGLILSTLDRNDGHWKELSSAQHKFSSPRLQDFKSWNLDEADRIERPFVVAHRADLPALRKKKDSPSFAPIWERIQKWDSGAGMRFAIEGDPLIAWRKKLEILHLSRLRAKMALLGRDFGDTYSPVGGRAITRWAEDYDLIAASGVFTPEEERTVRRSLMLLSHMFMEPDLMNWKYNSRNANFEADRVDIIGTVGVCFHGNPDAALFVEHTIALMEKSLEVYCTPGSGKWYENPACYYLHAAKCRMNVAFHLARHGLFDVTRMPRLKDFLRWAILLLTPPCPHSYEQMRDGLSEEAYFNSERVRRVPPIGDHAHLGPWVPDHYAMAASLYRKDDPAFSDLLLAAFHAGGGDGGHHGNPSALLAALSLDDLRPVGLPPLSSRRLEGFGAVFRDHFSEENEFYLLFKQGPGGYRYHRTEGGLILFVDGRPLLYDGGEAGETWRHSTLSFHDARMPLAAGHVERFHDLPGLSFVQGVHPKAIAPGEPVFLSDNCHHDLVRTAHERFAEPNPADVRSILVARDEYIVIHDDLRIDSAVPCRFHLQVVADAHSGDAAGGVIFRGRFGLDLQVFFPGQAFAEEEIGQLPILESYRRPEQSFAMSHLMVRAAAPERYLAVLRPLHRGKPPLQARVLRGQSGCWAGTTIQGSGIDDHLFLGRETMIFSESGLTFTGRYGAVIRRPESQQLFLLAGTLLESDGILIVSDGPTVAIRLDSQRAEITAEGRGRIEIMGFASPIIWELAGERKTTSLKR